MGTEVEKLFQEKGKRTLIFGCMHHNGSRVFKQTQTNLADLLPQVLHSGEDHRHLSAVTVDLRYAPDECIQLPRRGGQSLLAAVLKFDDIPSDGPDFARRDCENLSHLEDFQYVNDIKKIYAERIPFVEKGPLEYNIPFFKTIHRLLGKEGIFAFDFVPTFKMVDSKGDAVTVLTITRSDKKIGQSKIDEYINNSPLSLYFEHLKGGFIKSRIACKAHEACPVKPCLSLISQIAEEALTAIADNEEEALQVANFREEMSKKPLAVLTDEELSI